ncbi:hypothetical protein [Nocardioides jishulii]|uniref:Uncharacterized protein n=1 Tax=Nocardioides jishulii TaxID=2575440 RepID=A0A4U2YHV5_9ACTN|nr:hypothetical protein [Nocardioides jishulii]QCX26581.1 hypothetical protein FCL41_02745 [Nocardioides jishulii]TKI60450.1 hypothetical protein FC770_16805 [Nocardioides jishulii]
MDEKRHDVDAAEAARALEAIGTTRHQVAARVGSPPHYYTKVAAAAAILCLAQPLDSRTRFFMTLVAILPLAWAVRSYSRHTGTWTMATLREKGAWMAWLIIGVMVAALAAALLTQSLVVSVVGALVILLVVPVVGPRWDAAWVRSLTPEEPAEETS